MKILILHNYYKETGGEDTVVSLEKALLRLNGNVVKLFKVNNHQILDKLTQIKTALKIKYSRKHKRLIENEIKNFSPDIIHAHNLFPLLTPSIYDACIESKIPIVQTLHNYRLICPNALLSRNGHTCELCVSGSFYNAVFYRCYRDSIFGSLAVVRMLSHHHKKKTWLNKVDCFIALTNFAKNKFIEGGLPQEKIRVKPNFFIDNKSPLLQEGSRKGVLFLGRLSHEKGIKTLLQAWEALDIPLKIAGDGPLIEMITADNSSNITILGKISPSRVIEEMTKIRFIVMPSECYEGFPMVLVEAFAHGIPVVASNLGGMPEIIENNFTGLLFEAGNPKDLAKKVLWMHTHPEECIRMGENAKNVYKQKYTPEKNYEILMDIYQKTIETYEIKNS